MILNRIRSKIDKHLRPNPNGVWSGRSTTAHILALRRLIDHEGVKSHNLKAAGIHRLQKGVRQCTRGKNNAADSTGL